MALVYLSLTKVTMLSGTGTSPVIVCFFHCSLVTETPFDSHLTFTSLPCSTVTDLLGLSRGKRQHVDLNYYFIIIEQDFHEEIFTRIFLRSSPYYFRDLLSYANK